MKLLNVGCGGNRPQDPQWTNLDLLRTFLHVGTPERANLDAEPNYVEFDLAQIDRGVPLPFSAETFDGILLSHVLEHMSCHSAARVLAECRRVLRPGGCCVSSVPDCEYFSDNYLADTRESAVRLFGEPISEPHYEKFFDYALFHREHIQLFTFRSLECVFLKSGFTSICRFSVFADDLAPIEKIMNRRKFSLEVVSFK